jgi:hypothetical protein
MPCVSRPTRMFYPEAISVLDSALDGAWKSLISAGQLNGDAAAARTELAKHIIRMATKGEHDRQRLIQGALARFKRQAHRERQELSISLRQRDALPKRAA